MMNKEFEYRGHKFNIKVEFNTKVERRPNGERFHKITTSCMDYDNYYHEADVIDELLVAGVKAAECTAKKHIDDKLDEKHEDKRLAELGFK